MKILYDSYIFASQKFGGVSRYHYELLKGMSALGQEVKIAGSFIKNHYLLADKNYGRQFYNDAYALLWNINKQMIVRAVKQTRLYDLLHPTFPYEQMICSIPEGKKIVFTIHDMIPEKILNRVDASSNKLKFAQRADKIIAVSKNTKRDIVEILGVDKNKIEVVYHGTSLHLSQAVMPTAPLPEHFLLFVGGRNSYKNFDMFIAAVAPVLNANRELYVLCIGGKPFSDVECKRLKELNIYGRTLLMTRVTDCELAYLYAKAAAFIFPSLYEGCGIPILEAWACRVPVLLSNTGCFTEVAEDAAEYFDPTQTASITESINRLLSDRLLRRKLVDSGAKRLKNFSWNKMAKQTQAIYQSL
jgi:glycosyltransferase involved in cell wall biosynthesis